MISYLKGIVQFKEPGVIVLDVSGVGYQVNTPLYIWEKCNLKDEIIFLIYTHVREDQFKLYGFTNRDDKIIFLKLLDVSGIGPKTALNILSASQGARKIITAIEQADVNFFQSIKGTGKKTSQKIIIELKNSIGAVKDLDFSDTKDDDLINALKELGFSAPEIKKAISGIDKDLSLEEKIRKSLKQTNAK